MTSVFYFGQVQTLGLTFFGIIAGILMRFLHRYKVNHPFYVVLRTSRSR